MSKFAKRISKLVKFPRNALIIGTGMGMLEEILETFDTVFVVGVNRSPTKRKNLIFRERIETALPLPDIDVIFTDVEQAENLIKLHPVWNKFNSVIFFSTEQDLSKDIQKTLKNYRYQPIDVYKNYHIWKIKN